MATCAHHPAGQVDRRADARQRRAGAARHAEPANAALILIVWELAGVLTTRAAAPDLTVEQMCRPSRGSAELLHAVTV